MWWETHRDAEERREGELCRVLTRDAPREGEVAVRCPFAEIDQSEGALMSRGAGYCQVGALPGAKANRTAQQPTRSQAANISHTNPS